MDESKEKGEEVMKLLNRLRWKFVRYDGASLRKCSQTGCGEPGRYLYSHKLQIKTMIYCKMHYQYQDLAMGRADETEPGESK